MSEPDKFESQPKSKRDPAALSSEYHKAHKQLMLWSAILFIWELVGVDLSKAKDAGGNVGPIVTALKSPQAVPWVLLILVAYFLFKCTIEWAQCHVDRRRIRVAKVDFISAWVAALAAITLYIAQAISQVQIADRFEPPFLPAVLFLLVIVTLLSGLGRLARSLFSKSAQPIIGWKFSTLQLLFALVVGIILIGKYEIVFNKAFTSSLIIVCIGFLAAEVISNNVATIASVLRWSWKAIRDVIAP